uniref:Rhodopsin domain-containing protein n=1 Tax=Bionectria ochroleuca TaxID=29856 RepID=A0A8H7K7J4_BIOOC
MSDMLEALPGTFSHTGGRGTDVFLTAILLPNFSITIVVVRLWTSKFIVRRWYPDDTLAMIATIFAILHSMMVCIGNKRFSTTTIHQINSNEYALEARLGAGDYLFNFSPSNLELLLNVGRWGGVPLYNLTTVFIKASILMFYQRFTANRALKITTYAVLVAVIAYSLVNIIASFALDFSDPEKCDRLFVAYIVCAALNVATDVAILLLPFWILRPLQISTGRKIAIGMVLMGGGFVSAVSILRLVINIQTDKDLDTTYAWGNSVKWTSTRSLLSPRFIILTFQEESDQRIWGRNRPKKGDGSSDDDDDDDYSPAGTLTAP